MHPKFRRLLYIIFGIGFAATLATAQDMPVNDAFPRSTDAPKPYIHEHPDQNVPEGIYRSQNPHLTDSINEPHPVPEALNKLCGHTKFPKHYFQLLQQKPVDQIQSKIFDIAAFKAVRQIGVMGFENKVPDRFRDEKIGKLVANQFFQELESVRKYPVLDPASMEKEDVQMQIVATPKVPLISKSSKGKGSSYSLGENDRNLAKEIDAYMFGAVTRFSNKYINRHGELTESLGSSVEFGAFLIILDRPAKKCKYIWGARYTGSQTPSIKNIFGGRYRWLEKEELSRKAIKKIVKDFYKSN